MIAQLSNIGKRFGECVALDGVSLSIAAGERLAVVGENGAGKSTLMSVLAGLYVPTTGELAIDGAPVRFRSTKDALARGIAMVHQHFTLAPSLTVAENVVLGMEPTRRGLLDTRAAERAVSDAAARFGFSLLPHARTGDLSVASQQKVEIVKALYRKARILILDEPTAVLAPTEVEGLWNTLRALSESGVSVVLIAHKLREVMALATRIAVMRRGKLVADTLTAQTSAEQLAEWMVGGEHADPKGPSMPKPATSSSPGLEPVLQIEALEVPRGLRGASLALRPGEIVGLAGVDGNGQRELVGALTGARPWTRGSVQVAGTPLVPASPRASRALGIAHVPEDRAHAGLVGGLTVEENLALGRADRPPFATRLGGFIDRRGRRERAKALVAAFDVRPPDPRALAAGLSGGNQQKVVLARELDAKPRVLVAVQPTRGLDFAAVEAVHQKLREARDAGTAVLLVSLDLDELLALSDRLLVIAGGRIVAEHQGPSYSAQEIGREMLGAKEEARA